MLATSLEGFRNMGWKRIMTSFLILRYMATASFIGFFISFVCWELGPFLIESQIFLRTVVYTLTGGVVIMGRVKIRGGLLGGARV
jgi:hypothetical protein